MTAAKPIIPTLTPARSMERITGVTRDHRAVHLAADGPEHGGNACETTAGTSLGDVSKLEQLGMIQQVAVQVIQLQKGDVSHRRRPHPRQSRFIVVGRSISS